MTPIDIKVELVRRRVVLAELARRHGASQPHLSAVVAGRLKTPWLRRIIATSIGKTYEEVWGIADPGVDRLGGWPPVRVAYPYNTTAAARGAR